MSTSLIGWPLDVERGPDWLMVRLHAVPEHFENLPPLATVLWDLLQQHFTHRLVLECDDVPILYSTLIGQLVMLHKRLSVQGGTMRLCGLSEANRAALRSCRMDDRFPAYNNRHEAVLGFRPTQPR